MPGAHVADYDSGAITTTSVSSWAVSGVGVSVGDTLVVGVTYGGLGTTTNRTVTLADNLGNTYTEITLPAAQWYATNSTGLRVFKCQVTSAGTATITATPSANCDYTGIIARKFTGGSATEDGDNCALENSTTPASGAITTTVNGAIVVGFAANTSSTAGSITGNNGSFGGSYTITGTGMVSQYQIQATAGSVDSEPTVSVSANWISAIIALQPGASTATLSAGTATPGNTTATIGATTDQTSGTFYVVVDTAANLSGVTATQIKAGQKASGSAALASGNASVSTTTPSVGVTGLAVETLYSYAAVQNNTNGDSNVVTGTFTTTNGLDQKRFRFRNDDGSETAATWAAAENADVTIPALTPKRLRMQVAATGDPAAKSFKLQYRKVGDGTWRDIN